MGKQTRVLTGSSKQTKTNAIRGKYTQMNLIPDRRINNRVIADFFRRSPGQAFNRSIFGGRKTKKKYLKTIFLEKTQKTEGDNHF